MVRIAPQRKTLRELVEAGARKMIEAYGENAAARAAKNSDLARQRCDTALAHTWYAITQAIEKLSGR